MRNGIAFVLMLMVCALGFPAPAFTLSLDRLSEGEVALREAIMKKVVPFVDQQKSEGTAPLITFEELYAGLIAREVAFLEEFRAADPQKFGGSSRRLPAPDPGTLIVEVEPQRVLRDGKPTLLDAQYLPLPVHEAYRQMMAAMEISLGKRLLVESGYRSPAYQLYLFLFYMPKHGYSVHETNRFVALPGCSEHGSPSFQAIDFITPEGINGEDRPEEFEELQEYSWLHARAHEFGFHLSYPRGGQVAFEPWHWHWEGEKGRESNEQERRIQGGS